MNEYNVNEHLKICLQKLKTCALCVLMDKGYTKEKAVKAVETIKKFNVYETKTGFRIETLVDDLKTTVYLHSDNTEVKFFSEEKDPKPTTKTITIQDESDALNQGRIVNGFEHQTNDRLEKLENSVSKLQALVDALTNDVQSSINYNKGQIERLDHYDLFLYDKIKILDNKLQIIKDNFISLGDDLKT